MTDKAWSLTYVGEVIEVTPKGCYLHNEFTETDFFLLYPDKFLDAIKDGFEIKVGDVWADNEGVNFIIHTASKTPA